MSHQSDIDPELGEVLFEVKAVGNALKVSALDPVTNIEVSIVGSAYASPYSFKMNALRKLRAAVIRSAHEQA
ncbi:MAG: serine hydroxymethyltransferase [Rhodospirillaceae bacterium]|nr:serine hydroxymethyltransferase [Rhodospirillaceae bacterium]